MSLEDARTPRPAAIVASLILVCASFGPAAASPAIPAELGAAFVDQVAVAARIDVGSQPGALAVGDDGIWVVVREGLALVDPAHNSVIRVIAGPDQFAYSFAAASDEALWVQQGGVSTYAPLAVVRIDLATGISTTVASYEGGPHGIAVGFGSVWAIDISGVVTRIDLASGAVLARIPVDGPAWGIDVGQGAVWVAGMLGVSRIDPKSNSVVASVDVLNAVDLAVGPNLVWVTGMIPGWAGQPNEHAVFSIDPATNLLIHRIPLPGAYQLAVGEDVVWVVSDIQGELVGLDPLTGLVGQRLSVAPLLHDVAVVDGTIWVAQGGIEGDLIRIE